MARPKSNKASVVQPLIRSNGQEHILETIFEGKPEEMPLIKSVGYMPIKEGSSSWISYVITTKGKEVVSIEVDEPNLRAIAEESAKIAFVSTFVDQEF